MDTSPSMGPEALPVGLEVGLWRVVSLCGRGSYGAVYRVVHTQAPEGEAFALKMALQPWDPRFEREVELLRRVKHAGVPRLRDWGEWKVKGGGVFPYLVMEWVEGVPLYEWAEGRQVSTEEAAGVLAGVARALEAVHAVGGVHRDVKGGNVLVRRENGRAVLMDFGSGNYRGARPLTHQPPPPGTYEYQSPESVRFQWQSLRQREGRFEAGPQEDVYALGVTAYRLVTGRYPPEVEVEKTEEGYRVLPRAPVVFEPGTPVSQELAKLIRRMLSEDPSARGRAAQVAQTLEGIARGSRPETEQVLGLSGAGRFKGSGTWDAPVRRARRWAPWAALAVSGALAASGMWMRQSAPEEGTGAGRDHARMDEARDAGTVGLADAVLEVPASGDLIGEATQRVGLDMPKQPFPGQRQPPCGRPLVAVNGGCWVRTGDVTPPCGANAYEWKKECYVPALPPPRPQTSQPQ
ncbi:Serine/threonine protein kinase [Stigmatella aurantiaca]|uniref:Serine/threonine protein kinase n=1 Tax=Stigmatella aurantiaca TaxID=41 RepID=A0A1H7M1R0_STIAU|nr:serine/threonine-protein kinase [Stigmatella aurantiaca]SEL05029.1 Serine/threonine protein kinase [Stigmatella aurantiaca]